MGFCYYIQTSKASGFFSTLFLILLLLQPLSAAAIVYQPGATLDPACLPTDTSCGVVAPGGGNIIPDMDAFYDLGSQTRQWRDLYLSGNTLHLGGLSLSASTSTGALVWSGSNIETTPSASSTSEFKFSELAANGANYTGFKAPDALAANSLYILPSADGTGGQTLSTNGSGALFWVTREPAVAVGTTTQYFRGDKTWQTLDTSVVSENNNLYYTDARSRLAFSVSGPLAYNSATGAFSISQASSTASGYLSSVDWTAFNNKQTSALNNGQILIGNVSNVATGATISGDATISNAGVLTISNDAVVLAKLAADAVNSAKIVDGSIVLADLASGSVDGAKITDATITNADVSITAAILYSKLALGNSIVLSDLTADSVNSSKVVDGSIVAADLAFDAITTAKILDGTITNADVAATAAIALSKLASGTSGQVIVVNASGVPVYVVLSGDATVSNAGALTIANLVVTNAKLAADSVDSSKIVDGAITSTDISTTAGITNAQLASSTIGLAIGTSGIDVNILSPAALGNSLTLNIPDAGATARGLVTTGAQTFAGDKTFSGASTFATTTASGLTLSPMTQGSLLFAGAGGLVSQNNSNLFWDNTNNRFGIGTSAPTSKLDVVGDIAITNGVEKWNVGIDEADSNKFKISNNAILGINDRLTIDNFGNTQIKKGIVGSAVPASLTFHANYNTNINGSQGAGALTGTATGVMSVANGKLDLAAGASAIRYVSYAGAGNADSLQTGAIKIVWTPDYNGFPASADSPNGGFTLFQISQAVDSSVNRIRLQHRNFSGSNLELSIRNSAGIDIIFTNLGPFAAVAGQSYEFELNYDFTAGATRLFIDGAQFGATQTQTGIRSGAVNVFRVGSTASSGSPTNADFFIDNISVFNAVQHTANYTPVSAEFEATKLGLSFINDAATGLIHTGVSLDFHHNNIKTMTLNSGNVGIGTALPSTKLHVVGSELVNSQASAVGAGAIQRGLQIISGALGANDGTIRGLDISATVAGTTNIGDELTGLRVETGAIDANGTTRGLYIVQPSIVGAFGSVVNDLVTIERQGGTLTNALQYIDAGATKFVLNSAGNVGLGTTTPSASLHITPSTAVALRLDAYGASTGNTAEIRFQELAVNGANYTGFKSPDALAANVLYTLPNIDGVANQVLSTNGAGVLAWAAPSSGSTIPFLPTLMKADSQTGMNGTAFIYRNQLYSFGYGAANVPYGRDGSFHSMQPEVIPVENPPLGWQEVVGTYNDVCALSNVGTVHCWGYNAYGQLGDGTVTTRYFAKQINNGAMPVGAVITKIFGVSNREGGTTESSYYAIASTGMLYAWGGNSWGQLGDASITNRTTPVLVGSVALAGKTITKVSVSGNWGISVAALDSTGQLYTWGYNASGALGLGDYVSRSSPVAVSGFANVSDVITRGSSDGATPRNWTILLRADGTVWGAGNNGRGELGRGNTTISNVFVQEITGRTDIAKIFAGEGANGGSSAMVSAGGQLYLTGANTDGELGDGATIDRTSYYAPAGNFQGKVSKVVFGGNSNSGYGFIHILDTDGNTWCAGRNAYGQCGIGSFTASITTFTKSIRNNDGKKVIDIRTLGYAVDESAVMILVEDGSLMTTGRGHVGQLGSGVNNSSAYSSAFRYVIGFEPGSKSAAIGSTLPLNLLSGAQSSNTIDNTNFGQVWNWSTANTQTPLSLSANALTTGDVLNIHSSSTALTTGSLLDISLTGAAISATNFVGKISNISNISTAGGLLVENAGTGLSFQVNDDVSDITPFVVDASGNVGIGTSTPDATLRVWGNTRIGSIAGANPAYELYVANSGAGPVARFQDADGFCDINPTNASLSCASDISLKKNVLTLESSLEKVLALNPVTFNWRNEEDDAATHFGFIAQEVEELFPALVSTDEGGLKSLAYGNFTPILAKAVQELSAEVEKTKAEIASLADSFKQSLVAWFADASNGIGDFFAQKIHTEEVCLKKSDGSEYCVNGDNLEAIMLAPYRTVGSGTGRGRGEVIPPVVDSPDSESLRGTAAQTPATETSIEPSALTETDQGNQLSEQLTEASALTSELISTEEPIIVKPAQVEQLTNESITNESIVVEPMPVESIVNLEPVLEPASTPDTEE